MTSASPTTPSSSIRPTTARTTTPGPTPAPRRSAARRTRTGKAPSACRASSNGPAISRPATTLNGIVSHEDWLPTFAAAAGAPDIKEKLLKGGVELNGRTYKNHIDGYNLLDYLSGKAKDSPRKEFIYVGDDGAEVVAIRVGDWKATYLENRADQLQVWREPFVHLRLPLLFNLRRDPFEKSQHNSNTYHDWMIDRAFVLVPLQAVASKFLMTLKEFPPSQKPGDWSLDSLEKQIKGMTTAGE